MNNLVQLDKSSNAVTTTLIIAQHLDVEHRAVMKLINTHIDDLNDVGETALVVQLFKGRNKPTRFYNLDEDKVLFLITLMKNTELVRRAKKIIIKEFSRMKKELARIAANQTNEQWLEQRNAGKIIRRIETDVVSEFIAYAKSQGGSERGCDMYYANISSMENKALFLIERKYPNLRLVLGVTGLSTIQKADIIVSRALRDGMGSGKNYKDIYKMAKDRVELFADLLGRTPVSAMILEG